MQTELVLGLSNLTEENNSALKIMFLDFLKAENQFVFCITMLFSFYKICRIIILHYSLDFLPSNETISAISLARFELFLFKSRSFKPKNGIPTPSISAISL